MPPPPSDRGLILSHPPLRRHDFPINKLPPSDTETNHGPMRDFYPGRSQKFDRKLGNLSDTNTKESPGIFNMVGARSGGGISIRKQVILYGTIYRSQDSPALLMADFEVCRMGNPFFGLHEACGRRGKNPGSTTVHV